MDVPSLDNPSLVGDDDRALRVGDLDLRDFGRVKEAKSRFPSNSVSLWRTRNGFVWPTSESSGLGVLVSFLRDGERERDLRMERLGLSERRLARNALSVKTSSTPESWNEHGARSYKLPLLLLFTRDELLPAKSSPMEILQVNLWRDLITSKGSLVIKLNIGFYHNLFSIQNWLQSYL